MLLVPARYVKSRSGGLFTPAVSEKEPVMASVAQHLVAALKITGVTRVYGLPGDSLNGFTDAIRRSDSIS